MHLETLAKRLAEKTGTPVLEQVVLGQAPMEDLPMTCMLWTGAVSERAGVVRPQKRRNTYGDFYVEPVSKKVYASIKYQGKRHLVQRLIIQLIKRPNFEFTMKRNCAEPLCVNPYHWTLIGEPPTPPSMVDDWTEQDVEEVLPTVLAQRPENLFDHPDLDGAPPQLVQAVLKRMNNDPNS